VPAVIWKERHFLTVSGSPIKYHKELDQLLSSVYLPSKVAVIHCRSHQKGSDEVSEGNRLANLVAKAAPKRPLTLEATEAPLIWDSSLKENKPQFTTTEKEWALS
jgi:hypothetical protein